MFKATCLVATATIASAVRLPVAPVMTGAATVATVAPATATVATVAPATGVAALTDMDKLKALASKNCLAKAYPEQSKYIWSQITGRSTGADMTKEEALNAVEFLNKALPDGIQMNDANAEIIGVGHCLDGDRPGSLENANKTINCGITAVNTWSGANCNVADAARAQWYPLALTAWQNHLAKVAAVNLTGVAAITDMDKLLALASKNCLAEAQPAQGKFIWSQITGRDSGADMTTEEALNAVEFLNKALPAGIQMNDAMANEVGVGHCLNGDRPGALENAAKTINCGITAINVWSNACAVADAPRTQWYPLALAAWQNHLAKKAAFPVAPTAVAM